MNRIAGIVYPDVFQITHSIKPMLETLVKSPDEKTYFIGHEQLQMGSTASPIDNSSEIVAVMDGKFYPPSEGLIESYRKWGDDFIEHLDGDFAFALLDKKQNKLILARDRIGKKPLYWYKVGQFFLFASELKALMVTGHIPQTVAPEAIATYLSLGYLPQDITPIKDVNKLLPGYYLNYDLETGHMRIAPYWSLSSYFSKEPKEKAADAAKTLSSALTQSVGERLPKGNDVGCFVTGGLGSASVAYFVKEESSQKKVFGFTAGFKGQNDADSAAATAISNLLHIEHTSFDVTPKNFLDDLVPILWHLDEPIADPNIVATWHLARLAKGVDTVFSGMGSDELLAGHNRYTLQERTPSLLEKISSSVKGAIYRCLIPVLSAIGSKKAFTLLHKTQLSPHLRQYIHQNLLFSGDLLKRASPYLSALFAPDLFLEKFHHIDRIASTVSRFIYLDMKTRLPDQFIHQYERLTMAQHLEWKTPYLDRSIVEYAVQLPEPETLEEFETASYLKQIFRSTFPKEFVDRPKRMRRNILNAWLVESGLIDIFPLLKKGTLVDTGLIDEEWLENVTKSEELQRRHFNLLFAVLVLELWFRLYINRPVLKRPPKIGVKELLLQS